MPRQSRKQDVIEQVFNHVRQHQGPTSLVFDNKLVKQISGASFSNQFDVTKVDTSVKLPQVLRDNDFFIVHLGDGRHQFVKGISVGFHRLEAIAEGDVIPWRYRWSVLNEADTSEAKGYGGEIGGNSVYGGRKEEVHRRVIQAIRATAKATW